MQEPGVWSLVLEDPAGWEATKPARRNWTRAPQQEKPSQREARTQRSAAPAHRI